MPAPRYRIDPGFKEYGTALQKQCVDAVNEHRSMAAASRALGKSVSVVRDAIYALEKKAALCGFAPDHDMQHTVPEPFIVKGVSTYYDEHGKVKGQWIKSKLDQDQSIEAVKEFITYLAEDARGLSPAVKSPTHLNADLLCVYPFGDPHVGMYAWAAEAGNDFDLEIAEKLTLGAVDSLVASAPPAETAIILPLGDVFHANDQTNTTPGHKHQLDVDSRYPKVLMAGIKTFRHAILRAMEKHKTVYVRFVPGNHDPQAIWALAMAIAAYFENNPRVTVDLTPSKFWFHRFGKVLIGSTHGDTVKHEVLPGVMAADRPEDWGATKHRYWYTGHVHHQAVREFPGVVCESFRTLAAKDAWAAGHGYRAGRDMYCIVHHKEYGEVGRHRCDISMLEAA